MSKFLNLTLAATLAVAAAPAFADGHKFGLGRTALPEEIAAWDLDVLPDGTGLPVGQGDAIDGEEIFAEACAICHGDFAEGVDNWPKLAGGDGTLADEDPLKTVGSYWPYLSTTFDYVRRSMPFGNAQSLSNDEVYAIVAYILYSNDIIEDDFVLSNETFLDVDMPNAAGFIVDDRRDAEYAIWSGEPCMENCKDDVKITMHVLFKGDEEEAAAETGPAAQQDAAAPAAEAPAQEAAAPAAEAAPVETVALDAELVKKGEKVFKKCKACHQVGDKAKNKTGPILNGIIGSEVASVEKFKYSKAMSALGGTWTEENMAEFLKKPKAYVKGTKMSFAGLKKDKDIAAVTEYLKSFSE
ncbi:MAG: c-type cytochrome [Pelagimonas sp.]|jgi:cytochrome c|nr:c-type cytochrome [Pelagimonas sp.]